MFNPDLPDGAERPPPGSPAPDRRADRGALRAAAGALGRRQPGVVPGAGLPGRRPPLGPADAARRHPRRRRRRPPGRAGRRRHRPVLLELRDPAGGDRRAGVPVADRAHRAGRRLGRPGPDARRHGHPARLSPAGRPVGRHVLRRADESGVRRPRPRGRRRRRARPRDGTPGRRRTTTSPCRARAMSSCTAAMCCHWSAPVAEGSARRPVRQVSRAQVPARRSHERRATPRAAPAPASPRQRRSERDSGQRGRRAARSPTARRTAGGHRPATVRRRQRRQRQPQGVPAGRGRRRRQAA